MPAVEPPITSSESGLVKMEDRKRPAADNNDSAPPLKKQATSVNGGSKPHPDADMPWKDDLEVSLCFGFLPRFRDRFESPLEYMLIGLLAIAVSKRSDFAPDAGV
jgi:hypothetical protein